MIQSLLVSKYCNALYLNNFPGMDLKLQQAADASF